jgi:hypothetical protein
MSSQSRAERGVRFPEYSPFGRLATFPEAIYMNRSLGLAARLVYLSLALLPALSYAQSKTAAPTITVYKTPT